MKISELPADEAAANLYAAYMAHHDAIANGTAEGPHPSKDVTRWRAAAAGADDENTGLGPKEIEPTDHGADNPSDFTGKPANPTLVKPAQDAAGTWVIGLDHARRFVPVGGVFLPGDRKIEARSNGPSTAGSQRAMNAAIPGYFRVR